MRQSPLHLDNDVVSVVIDPTHGCEITDLVHRSSGLRVLHETPWAEQARLTRSTGVSAGSTSGQVAWLQRDVGGLQTLFPNAGPSRQLNGVKVGYHGEASTASWRLCDHSATSATLSLQMMTVPVRVTRRVTLRGNAVAVEDVFENLSDCRIEYDLVYHPTFGSDLLQHDCSIEPRGGVDERSVPGVFTSFEDHDFGAVPPGSVHRWPQAGDVELSAVPAPPSRRTIFGHLSELAARELTVTNTVNGLSARLTWSGDELEHVWFWQELNNLSAFPWFRRCRQLGLEPATRPTSGTWNPRTLEGHGRREFAVMIAVGAPEAPAPSGR